MPTNEFKSAILSLLSMSADKRNNEHSLFDYSIYKTPMVRGREFLSTTTSGKKNPSFKRFIRGLGKVYIGSLSDLKSNNHSLKTAALTRQFYEICLYLEAIVHTLHRCTGAPFKNQYKEQYKEIESSLQSILGNASINFTGDEPPVFEHLSTTHINQLEPWPEASKLISTKPPANDCSIHQLLEFYGLTLSTLSSAGLLNFTIKLGLPLENKTC